MRAIKADLCVAILGKPSNVDAYMLGRLAPQDGEER